MFIRTRLISELTFINFYILKPIHMDALTNLTSKSNFFVVLYVVNLIIYSHNF